MKSIVVLSVFYLGTLVALRCQRSSADRADRFRRTHRSPQQEELEVQMMFVLLAITIVFTLCWTPLQVIRLSMPSLITNFQAINLACQNPESKSSEYKVYSRQDEFIIII